MPSYLALLSLIILHAVVDGFAMFVEPLWPTFSDELGLSRNDLLLVMTFAALAPSFSQVGFGYLRDRFGTRFLLVMGPVLAATALSLTGLATSSLHLIGLLMLGGVAVGAFHPVAAVTAGELIPERRTRCLSLFMFGGTCGLALGPVVSGHLVHWFHLPGLAWATVPGVLLAGGLGALAHRMSRERGHRQRQPASMEEVFDGRLGYTLLLLAVCSLRVVPSIGMSRALAFLMSEQRYSPDVIGNTIGVFLFSGGMGMLVTASLLRHGWERAAMIICPLAGLPLLMLLAAPDLSFGWRRALLVPTGIILTGTTPAMVSYSQQLLPRGAGLASSITMGLSWGLAGILVAVLVTHVTPLATIAAFAPCVFLSAFGALYLPALAEQAEELPAAESQPA